MSDDILGYLVVAMIVGFLTLPFIYIVFYPYFKKSDDAEIPTRCPHCGAELKPPEPHQHEGA